MDWSKPKLTTYWPPCISNVTQPACVHSVRLASLLWVFLATTLPFEHIDHPCDRELRYSTHHLKAGLVCPGAKKIKFSSHGGLWKDINGGNNPVWHASSKWMDQMSTTSEKEISRYWQGSLLLWWHQLNHCYFKVREVSVVMGLDKGTTISTFFSLSLFFYSSTFFC